MDVEFKGAEDVHEGPLSVGGWIIGRSLTCAEVRMVIVSIREPAPV